MPIDTKPSVVAFETEAVLTQTFIQSFPYIKTCILTDYDFSAPVMANFKLRNGTYGAKQKFSSHSVSDSSAQWISNSSCKTLLDLYVSYFLLLAVLSHSFCYRFKESQDPERGNHTRHTMARPYLLN